MKIYEDFANECWVFKFSDDFVIIGPSYDYVAAEARRELEEFLKNDEVMGVKK